MARPRSFDEDQALNKAMVLFWQRGYEQTSLDDLVKATGMHRGSLYALYVDKRGLLLAALARYIDEVVRPQTQGLRSRLDGWAALESFFADLAQGLSNERAPPCCLTIHCAVGAASKDSEVAARVRHATELLEDALQAAIQRAQLGGDIPRDKDARELAGLLRCMIQGMQIFARSTPRHPGIALIPQQLLAMLRA